MRELEDRITDRIIGAIESKSPVPLNGNRESVVKEVREDARKMLEEAAEANRQDIDNLIDTFREELSKPHAHTPASPGESVNIDQLIREGREQHREQLRAIMDARMNPPAPTPQSRYEPPNFNVTVEPLDMRPIADAIMDGQYVVEPQVHVSVDAPAAPNPPDMRPIADAIRAGQQVVESPQVSVQVDAPVTAPPPDLRPVADAIRDLPSPTIPSSTIREPEISVTVPPLDQTPLVDGLTELKGTLTEVAKTITETSKATVKAIEDHEVVIDLGDGISAEPDPYEIEQASRSVDAANRRKNRRDR
jgi:hypothetical protein